MALGRPEKIPNWDIVELKMKAGCNAIEIYGELGMDDETFAKHFKNRYGESFPIYSQLMHKGGKGNIKAKQYEKAMKGDSRMLSLLGVEWLGQGKVSDTIESQQYEPLIKSMMDCMKESQDLSKDLNNADNINPNDIMS
jgi:hypothetical protein